MFWTGLVSSGGRLRRAMRKWGVAVVVASGLAAGAAAVHARAPETPATVPPVALATLPQEAQATHQRILSGGPFPYRQGRHRVRQPRTLAAAPGSGPLPGIHREDARGQRTVARVASFAAAVHRPAPRPVITPTITTRASAASCSERRHRPICSFCFPRRKATMELQTIRPNIVQAIRAYRVDDLMKAAAPSGQHFLYANLSSTQSKQEVLEAIAAGVHLPGALRQEPRCPVRLHDRPRAQGRPAAGLRGRARADCPTTRASTARRASSCWRSSATPPNSGGSDEYRSGVSILFSSPLPGIRVMGAGDGSGPGKRSQGSEGGAQERHQPQLRHEHADDEQRFRHRGVVERRVDRRTGA